MSPFICPYFPRFKLDFSLRARRPVWFSFAPDQIHLLSPILPIDQISKNTYGGHKCEGKSWEGDNVAWLLRFDWDWLRFDWSQIQKLSDIASLSFDLQENPWRCLTSIAIKIVQLLELPFLSFHPFVGKNTASSKHNLHNGPLKALLSSNSL